MGFFLRLCPRLRTKEGGDNGASEGLEVEAGEASVGPEGRSSHK